VFGALVSEIKKSNHKVGNVDRSAAMAELQDIRGSIDNIDASIIHMLAERFRFIQKVGILKARHNMPPSDPGREAQQITRLREIASAAKSPFCVTAQPSGGPTTSPPSTGSPICKVT
jgi:chorismate mutase